MTLKSSSDRKSSCTSKNETYSNGTHPSETHSSCAAGTEANYNPTFIAYSETRAELRTTHPRSSGMHIPAHVVVLFIAIFIFESSVLFVYTIIGLVKSNPTPYFTPTFSNPPVVQCIQYEQAAVPQAITTSVAAILYPSERFGTRQSQAVDDAGVNSIQTEETTSEAPLAAVTSSVIPRSATTLLQKPAFVTSIVLLTTVLEGSTTMPRSTMFVTTVVPLPTDSG